ncbi:5'-methylthioadenosine/S-adenosylhomocysteine nucleosidase family protein [Aspergillus lucknowensis]|uniref:Nucleoside phosphorylase domain-containing protein n=1 Tax=Aspergillus lucknowensis TaxID=176173 RepID=A0ABR4LD89_9EURO
MVQTRLSHHDYTIAWICALPLEMAGAKAMLDEIHPDLPARPNDQNAYVLGTIRSHHVVVACLPSGVYGTTSAATVAAHLLSTFPAIQFGLMVGIGGGAPTRENDIRLGDVVVSTPQGTMGGVVQYDFGKTIQQGAFQRTGVLNRPPQALLMALSKLRANHLVEDSQVPDMLTEMLTRYPNMQSGFASPGPEHDHLFESAYDHPDANGSCGECDASKLVSRPSRAVPGPVIHYGIIASGNQVMKHGVTRDRLAKELGVICFEMEAAGLADNLPCLVIRGICDYSDSHKNKEWQGYAAATAAAWTKALLSVIHPRPVTAPDRTFQQHTWMIPVVYRGE